MGSRTGALKAAARKAGISYHDYVGRLSLGLKRCWSCRSWREHASFGSDRSRADGLEMACRDCVKLKHKRFYKNRKPHPGRRVVAARDGDKKQARQRVNYLVVQGLIQNPNSAPCSRCAHSGEDRRHELHHHKGYAAEHHEDVIVLCAKCHHEVK